MILFYPTASPNMSIIATLPQDYLPEITGYADPWTASPGEDVAIKISCTEPAYSHRTVCVIQGVEIEHSPTKKLEEVRQIPLGRGIGPLSMGSTWLVCPR